MNDNRFYLLNLLILCYIDKQNLLRMAKGATHYIQRPQGDRRWVTPACWNLLKDSKGYLLINVKGQEPQQSQPSTKKNEVVGHVEEKSDHQVITFDEQEPFHEPEPPNGDKPWEETGLDFVNIDPDIDEITSLRDEYEELTGNNPDKRWKEKSLKAKIEAAK